MSSLGRRPRDRRRRNAVQQDPAAVERWVAALREGAEPSEVATQLLALDADAGVPVVRSLGAAAGEAALSVLGRLAESAPGELGLAAVEALGDIPAQGTAEMLEKVARGQGDRALRTAARRILHRLSAQGIRVQTTTAAVGRLPGARVASLYRAIGSSYDGRGERSLWLGAERPLGGIYLVGLLVSDVEGLMDCSGRDTTRKRFAEQEAEMRRGDPMAWVELPLDYARQLVQESAELARAAGRRVPREYALWAEVIGAPSEPLVEALVYREIRAFEAQMHPTWMSESPRLFEQPEVEPWFFPPEQVEKWATQLAEPPSARLVVTPETEAGRRERLMREAIAELLPPPALRGLRRRLEETAYVFLQTNRELDARRSVAAAATIEEERPLRRPHPFLLAMLQRSIEIALQVQERGRQPVRLVRTP